MKIAFLVVSVVPVLSAVAAFFGVPFLWRNEGHWIVATTIPQICWVPYYDSGKAMTQGTGWHKHATEDLWFRVMGEPHTEVSVEELRAQGFVR